MHTLNDTTHNLTENTYRIYILPIPPTILKTNLGKLADR